MKVAKYIFLLMFTVFALSSCGNSTSENADFSKEVIAVNLAKAQTKAEGNQISASGIVEATESALISTRMMGTIDRIHVNIGDKVKKGQLLISLSAFEIEAKQEQVQAQINVAEVALNNAQKDYDRYKILFGQNSATQKELENVGLQYAQAKGHLAEAREGLKEVRANLDYANLKASFDGIITQKMVEPGNIASPGAPLLAMEGNGGVRIKATVSEREIGSLAQGDPVQIYLSAIQRKIVGKINRISSSSAHSAGRFTIEIEIPKEENAGIRSGMYANVLIEGKSSENNKGISNKVLIPVTAIIQKHELQGIYTVSENGTALLRWIRTGKTYGDVVEVLSGLRADEEYIEQADGRLYNGAPIRLKTLR